MTAKEFFEQALAKAGLTFDPQVSHHLRLYKFENNPVNLGKSPYLAFFDAARALSEKENENVG